MSDETIESLCQEIERLTAEVERLSVFHEDDEPSWRHKAEKLQSSLAQAEQERDRLRTALENLARRCATISYPTDPSALAWNAAIDQAQQALGQKEGA